MQKTEEEGSCFEESLAVFRNTGNESGYSPNQLFFLRNWLDPNLPHMLVEPVVQEMVEATDKVRAGSKGRADNHKRGWPKLHLSDMVRGRHPKTKEWRMKGEVVEAVYGNRSVNVVLEVNSSWLFKREDIRLESTKRYQKVEEEELNSLLVGTSLEARNDHELEETMREPRKARQAPNTDQD